MRQLACGFRIREDFRLSGALNGGSCAVWFPQGARSPQSTKIASGCRSDSLHFIWDCLPDSKVWVFISISSDFLPLDQWGLRFHFNFWERLVSRGALATLTPLTC